jgi:hypothetical protein
MTTLISPPAFDAAYKTATGRDITTYNFAVQGTDGRLFQEEIKVLGEAFTREKRRADFFVIEFDPAQSVVGRDENPKLNRLWNQQRAQVMSTGEILRWGLSDPLNASPVLAIKAIGFESDWVYMTFSEMITPRRFEALDEYRLVGPPWDTNERGGRIAASTPEVARVLARVRADETMKKMAKRGAGVYDQPYDDRIIDALIAACQKMAPYAERGYVIFGPINRYWAGDLSPAAQERIAKVADRVRKETGLGWLDFHNPTELQEADFLDMSHLIDGVKFSPILAKRIAEDVAPKSGTPDQ